MHTSLFSRAAIVSDVISNNNNRNYAIQLTPHYHRRLLSSSSSSLSSWHLSYDSHCVATQQAQPNVMNGSCWEQCALSILLFILFCCHALCYLHAVRSDNASSQLVPGWCELPSATATSQTIECAPTIVSLQPIQCFDCWRAADYFICDAWLEFLVQGVGIWIVWCVWPARKTQRINWSNVISNFDLIWIASDLSFLRHLL